MSFLSRNIEAKGRKIRLGIAVVCIAASAALWMLTAAPRWACLIILAIGAFVAFEALRGWCVLRACKLKTPF